MDLPLADQLKQHDKKTPKFSLDKHTKLAKVVDIYDGDSCRVVFEHNRTINMWNIRMVGYDTPEMRPRKDVIDRDQEIAKAKAARDYLKSLIMNEDQLVYVKCQEFDKYGRLLAKIYINQDDTVSVNKMMIDNGHGYPYHGGNKKKAKAKAKTKAKN